MLTTTVGPETPASVRALLAGAIDYAGLFPPSAVSMSEAVLNYATYRNSNYGWLLGRFVVSSARLDEFIENAGDFVPRDEASSWRLSVVIGDDVVGEINRVNEFNKAHGPGVFCDTVEIRVRSAAAVEDAAASAGNLTAYFELALNDELPDLVSTIAIAGQRAKIRTGGVTPDAFPKTSNIIRFVKTCLAANVPFKATAGLHHPIRCFKPLTYEADPPTATMHGFLNVFLMSGFAREGYRQQLLEAIMEDEFEEVFKFEDQAAVWRDEHRLTLPQIQFLRQKGIQSFGSCSFDEPVADLQELGIL